MSDRNENVQIHSMTIEHTVYYAVQEPTTFSSSTPLLLALHGYGQNCRRFLRDFGPMREKEVLVVAPQAPNQFYFKYDPPTVGFSWLTSYEKENSINGFLGYMSKLRTTVHDQYGVNVDRPYLLGFSQSVSMVYRLAARGGIDPLGLIACCADLPPDVEALLPSLKPFPVLLVHGKDDPIIPAEKSLAAERTLRSHGFKVNTYYFDGGHLLMEEQYMHIAEWIAAIHACECC